MLGDFYNTMNMAWHHLDYGGVLIEEVFLYIQLLEREVESITPALSPTLSLSLSLPSPFKHAHVQSITVVAGRRSTLTPRGCGTNPTKPAPSLPSS